jgi:hypothetical protein
LVLALLDQVELVGFDVVEELLCTAGPADLNSLDAGRFGQSEVGAQVALREIAPASSNLADLREPASYDANPGTHRVAIAFRSD